MTWFIAFLDWIDAMPDAQCLVLAALGLIVTVALMNCRNRTSY